jgi:hypothetical protein
MMTSRHPRLSGAVPEQRFRESSAANGSEEIAGRQALSINKFDIEPMASALTLALQTTVWPANVPAFPRQKDGSECSRTRLDAARGSGSYISNFLI